MEKFLYGIILSFILVTTLSVYKVNRRILNMEKQIAQRDSLLLTQDSVLLSKIQYQGKLNRLFINKINLYENDRIISIVNERINHR